MSYGLCPGTPPEGKPDRGKGHEVARVTARFSKSSARRRLCPNQEKVRLTTQQRGRAESRVGDYNLELQDALLIRNFAYIRFHFTSTLVVDENATAISGSTARLLERQSDGQ